MKKILLLSLIIIFIPFVIVINLKKEEIIKILKYGSYNNKIVKVKISETNEIKEIPLEQYVLGVVAGEMPANFNIEALKAQAVASRTYVLKRVESTKLEYDVDNTTKYQAYITEEQMKEKWKENYEKNYSKIKEAVINTKNEAIFFEDKIIDAVFFSTSNGYTENSIDVFSSALPYLTSVSSMWDKKESPVFSTSLIVSKNEFLFNLGLDTNSDIKINKVDKTNTGRVKKIIINEKEFQASEIRTIFKLRSTSFDIKINNDLVTFNVNGYGHGVGMSQYGANGMAKEGYNYIDILKHYYKNCEIKNIN